MRDHAYDKKTILLETCTGACYWCYQHINQMQRHGNPQ